MGKVAAYRRSMWDRLSSLSFERLESRSHRRPSGPWTDAGMAIESEITLSNEERGKEWEYRVIAVNKAG